VIDDAAVVVGEPRVEAGDRRGIDAAHERVVTGLVETLDRVSVLLEAR